MNNNTPKFVFLGTPDVSSSTLKILKERGFIPSLIITGADKPSGRGLALTPSPTKVWAIENNIPFITPLKINEEVINSIREMGFVFAVVVAYGQILPQEFLDIFPKGVINIHYSLLPKYRGASPTEAALLHGDKFTGVTIQKMVFKLDAGDIIAQKDIAISDTVTVLELRPKLIELGANLLSEVLPSYISGETKLESQDESLVSKCGKIKKEDGDLTHEANDEVKWNKYRAYREWPRTYFFKDNKRYIVTKASFDNGRFKVEKVIPEGKKEVDFVE